jgi:hypothetical protein
MKHIILLLFLATISCKTKDSKTKNNINHDIMTVIGVYKVDNESDVNLIEMVINDNPTNVDIVEITQEIDGAHRMEWQSPWDEKYLNENGDKIIGDYLDIPSDGNLTRLVFFFHYLDFEKPLLTVSS